MTDTIAAEVNTLMFWDIYKILTYNALFNLITGNRGCGKTFGFKDWAIKDFIKTGAQFVYVRRYKQELKKNAKFFNDIAYKFPEHKFEVKGPIYLIDGKEAGCAMALSTSKIEKSTPFPLVNKIGFDEFIIDKGTYRYLPDEVINFLELYETVARPGTPNRKDVRVFFLSNAITVSNPYFMYFHIELPRQGALISRRGDILLQLVQDPDFIEMKKNTRFGKMIQGTEYADYSIENKFLRDNDTFLEKKGPASQFYFTFKYKGLLYGVWLDYALGRMWVSYDVDPYCRIIYSITLDDHTANTMLIKRLAKATHMKLFLDNYKLGNVFFEDMKIKNVVYDVIRLMII